MKVGLIN